MRFRRLSFWANCSLQIDYVIEHIIDYSIPSPAVFARGPRLKEFILTKLINAQMACLKAEEFSKLELRTRTTLLNNLEEELSNKTQEFIGGDAAPQAVKNSTG